IKSLEHIGDKKMADLIQRADNIYQKNKKLIDKAREKDLFDSDLYERLEELSELDREYYKLNEKTMTRLEKYIRKNPNEFCLDEEGKEFDMKYSGECKTYHKNNQVKEFFNLDKGVISGTFKSLTRVENLKKLFSILMVNRQEKEKNTMRTETKNTQLQNSPTKDNLNIIGITKTETLKNLNTN